MSSVDVTKLNILIVEDNVHFRTLIRSILQALGVSQIAEAQDGIEAMEVLDVTCPDLVIVDWKMEGMDGVEFVKSIRQVTTRSRFVPIIMVTGYTETSLVKKAREAGANDFLGKPISAQSLLGRIIGVFENPSPYFETANYFGPDRRHQKQSFEGKDRRKEQTHLVQPPAK